METAGIEPATGSLTGIGPEPSVPVIPVEGRGGALRSPSLFLVLCGLLDVDS